MFQWFQRLAGRARQTVSDTWVTLVPAQVRQFAWTIAGKFLPLAQKAYGLNTIVYSCVRLMAQSVAEPPMVAARRFDDGTHERLPDDHPLVRLIRRPNELMTEYEFWELTETHIDIGGRAHWWKYRDAFGFPMELWPIRPDRLAPAYSLSNEPGLKLLAGWHYTVPGEDRKIFLPRNDVVTFGLPDPSGESGGVVEFLGPCQVLAREIAADNEATSFVGSLLSNYAQPSMVIKTKSSIPDRAEARRLKQNFMLEFGGARRGEPALLDGDTEIEKLTFTLKDLEFPSLRKNAETRVSAAFGVPAILVGLSAGLDRATYSNAEHARLFFAETTLESRWRRYEDQYTLDIAAEFDDGDGQIIVTFDRMKVVALAASRLKQVQPIKDGFHDGAVMLNEYRQAVLGLDPIDGGDVLYIPSGVRPATSPDASAAPTPIRTSDLPRAALKAGEADDEEDIPEAAATALAAYDTLTESVLPEIRSALRQQRKRIIQRYRAATKADPTPDELMMGEDGAAMQDALTKMTTKAWGIAYGDASKSLDVELTLNLEHPALTAAYDDLGTLVKGIDATTRQLLAETLAQAIDEGISPYQVAQRLSTSFGFSLSRAETIARTESAKAYAAATVTAYEESGLVTSVYIYDGQDWDEPCRKVHGTIQSLSWYKAHPIEHPNCRRAASPVVVEVTGAKAALAAA